MCVCPYVLKYADSFYLMPYLNLLKIELNFITKCDKCAAKLCSSTH